MKPIAQPLSESAIRQMLESNQRVINDFAASILNLVQPVGIEPTSSVLQTGAMTTSAKVAYLVVPTRFELVTFTMSTYCSTTELRN